MIGETKTLGADPIRTINSSSFVQVTHPDHHMYSASNNVTVSGVTSGITTTLEAISSTTQTAITIVANSDFVTDSGGSNITIKIGDEIIQGTKTNATTITASTRGYDGTTTQPILMVRLLNFIKLMVFHLTK